jgi:hypothetical protein
VLTHKRPLHHPRDLELCAMQAPCALHFRIFSNPQQETFGPCACIFLVMNIENRPETPKMVSPKRQRHLSPVPSGPPAIPREVRAGLAASGSFKGASLTLYRAAKRRCGTVSLVTIEPATLRV